MTVSNDPRRCGPRAISAVFAVFTALLATSAPASASSLGEGLLIVSDFEPPRAEIRVMEPSTGLLVYDFPMSAEVGESCDRGAFCFPTGMRYSPHDGDDYIDMAITVNRPRGATPADKFYSVVERIRPSTPPEVMWKIRELDFTGVPAGDYDCEQDPADPCAARDPSCRVAFAEGIEVVEDRPEDGIVSVVIADGIHGRVLRATLDYSDGGTCAQVDWVLGEGSPAWPVSERVHPVWPNSVQWLEEGGKEYVLVDFFTSAMEKTDPLGASQIHLFRHDGAGFTKVWAFPESEEIDRPFLNTPHMAEILRDPSSGERWLWYSHSRGAADDWEADSEGYGATFGLAALGASIEAPPKYRLDAGFFEADRELMFSRDQDYMADGTMLWLDAGCQNLCPYEPVLYHIDPSFLRPAPTTALGSYSPDHTQQVLTQIPEEAILDEIRCGFGALFEAHWIPGAEVGRTLKAASRSAVRSCYSGSRR